MRPKGNPKCLVGTAQIDLGSTLTTSSLILSLKATFASPQGSHFALIWTLFGPHFQALQPALTSFSGQTACAEHNVAKHSFFKEVRYKMHVFALPGELENHLKAR